MNAPDRVAPLIPVTLLTGFLGSGKTTVLNRLLKRPGMEGAVVIVNEFGEVGLDHLLIEASEERFALLDNGCVCCTVRGDLVETLADIERRSAAGEIPAVRQVLIETTGLADPAPILHTLMAEPALVARYRIGGVVTTVDAVNGSATLDRHVEAAKQVAVADRLLVTKSDLADPVDLARLRGRLADLAPAAEMIVAEHGEVAADHVFDTGTTADQRAADLAAALDRAAHAAGHHHGEACGPGCAGEHYDHHHHDHGHAHHGIATCSYFIERPVDRAAFSQWLGYIAALKGEDLLRMKGIVNVAGEPDRPLVVHGVQHVLHPPAWLDGWPSADRRSRLVFIVRGIEPAVIERTLKKFAAIEASSFADVPARSAA
jgi:G3E family GTPase